MKKSLPVFIVLLVTFPFFGKAQSSIKVQAGLSYIEHFSIGTTYSFSEKHKLSILYGSNFFVKPTNFSSLFLQYDLALPILKYKEFTPRFGLKGGYAIFTDNVYQWQVITAIPFAGIQYPLNNKTDIFLETGVAISFEQAAKRLSYEGIGIYKTYLPEIKVGISYTLFD